MWNVHRGVQLGSSPCGMVKRIKISSLQAAFVGRRVIPRVNHVATGSSEQCHALRTIPASKVGRNIMVGRNLV
jgi:hypothetical protein